MATKFITPIEYQKIILPNEELTFSNCSLVSSVKLPNAAIFFAAHGNLRMVGAQGTVTIMRVDFRDSLPFNIDEYSFDSHQTGPILLLGPLKPEKNHWTATIPSHLKPAAPQWVDLKVEERIKEWNSKKA